MSYDINKLKQVLPDKKIAEPIMVPVGEVAASNAETGMQELLAAVDRGCSEKTGDFYIAIILRSEVISPNVFRQQYVVSSSCPSPTFDQSVFKYTRADGKIDYLWTVPNEDACLYLKSNAWLVDKEEQWMLSFVLQYYSGKLLQLAKRLNGERADSVALESGSKLEGAQTVILSEKGE